MHISAWRNSIQGGAMCQGAIRHKGRNAHKIKSTPADKISMHRRSNVPQGENCTLKIHKRENFFGSDFEIFTFLCYLSLNIKVL
jgi:hypothetical protein